MPREIVYFISHSQHMAYSGFKIRFYLVLNLLIFYQHNSGVMGWKGKNTFRSYLGNKTQNLNGGLVLGI